MYGQLFFLSRLPFASAVGVLVGFFVVETIAIRASNLDYFPYDLHFLDKSYAFLC